ncbi:polyamine-modulated factor 1 [Mugil cephalus]|uniref:polyamine-modulated factor 1 n=1 Tax=Mugil cephalus TaxID=48193 RepID=UPI001FB8297B|nr:polyamine-modulated factor 1 [Mugil cephalus]
MQNINRKLEMETNKVAMKEGENKTSANEKLSDETPGEASSQMSNQESDGKPSSGKSQFNRLKLFDKVMQTSLNKYIEHASFNRFVSIFRPLYKKNPQRMESIHKQFIEELKKTIQEDINRLIEEGRLEFKLNELDKLERAAKNNADPAWRPSGVPEQDFCSFLMPYYQKQEAYMRLELKKIQQENAALAQKVQGGRERIAQTEHLISTAVDEWKSTASEFQRLTSSLCPADVFDA